MLCCGDPQGERCLCPTPHVVRTAGQATTLPQTLPAVRGSRWTEKKLTQVSCSMFP